MNLGDNLDTAGNHVIPALIKKCVDAVDNAGGLLCFDGEVDICSGLVLIVRK